MNRVLIMLYVPALEKVYDVWIPAHRRVHSIIKLLVKAVNELNDGSFVTNGMPLLYNKMTGNPYDINLTIKETDIRSGTEVVLI